MRHVVLGADAGKTISTSTKTVVSSKGQVWEGRSNMGAIIAVTYSATTAT